MNEPPGARFRAGHAAFIVAEFKLQTDQLSSPGVICQGSCFKIFICFKN